jgi:outer membrane protein assembly factor BamE (lipoprotein component of BamABCDE complex)
MRQMNRPPNPVKQGSFFKPNKPMFQNHKLNGVAAESGCFNSLALARRGSILRTLFVFLFVLVIGTSCVGKRLSKANVDEVTEGMSKKQVESILGPPTNIDNRDFIVMKKTTYVYRQGKETVTIVFKDDKVTDKQSTLSD